MTFYVTQSLYDLSSQVTDTQCNIVSIQGNQFFKFSNGKCLKTHLKGTEILNMMIRTLISSFLSERDNNIILTF